MYDEQVIKLLKELGEAEMREIQGSAGHISKIKDPIARFIYELAIYDATRHLEIFSTILNWMEEGKPSPGGIDILPEELGEEIGVESGVREKVTELLSRIDDPDTRVILERVVGDELQHEKILKYLLSSLSTHPAAVGVEARVPTQFPAADRLLLGGLPAQKAVLIASPPCSEKDELVRAFCGAVPAATIFVSSNVNQSRELSKLYPELREVVCNPQAGLLKKTEGVQTLPGVENTSDINIALMRSLETISAESPRIYLQLVSDVLLFHKALTTRRWLADLLPRLIGRQCTVLAELNPGMHSVQEVQALLDLFDGRLEIVEREEAGRFHRFLRVATMRGHRYLQREVSLTSG